MAWSTILAAVVVAILAIALLWSINKTLENNREQRRQKVAGISRRCGSFNDLLNSIPIFYLGKELTLFALEQLIALHQELLDIEPKNERAQAALLEAQLKFDQVTQLASLPSHSVNSSVEAQNLRQSLLSASRFIQNLHHNGQIEINKARQLLNHIRSKALQISIDMLLTKADESRREKKYPVAVLMYQRALNEAKQINTSPEKTALMAQIQSRIDETTLLQQTQVEQNEASTGEVSAEHPHGHSVLEDEFDKSLKNEDAWKKRAY